MTADTFYQQGIEFFIKGQFEFALSQFNQSIEIDPQYAKSYTMRGIVYHALGQPEKSLVDYNSALSFNPNQAAAYCNRGIVRHQLGDPESAIKDYDSALELDPSLDDAYMNKAFSLLSLGCYEEGFQLHEYRWRGQGEQFRRRYAQPLWLGDRSLVDKTIFVYYEQGLGDTIQFCRYLTMLKDQGAEVVFEIQPQLYQLLKDIRGVDKIISVGDRIPYFDYHCPLMSLPLAFKTKLDTIPNSVPYITADTDKIDKWRQRLSNDRLNAGIVWNGGFKTGRPDLYESNNRRNTTLDHMSRLQTLNMNFYSLQKGDPAESDLIARKEYLWPTDNLFNYTAELTDYSETAALIANLDMVITVCTSVAHLAGALGKPVYLLLGNGADWRWLNDRTDNPWYPTMKVYRGSDWTEVFDKLIIDLQKI